MYHGNAGGSWYSHTGGATDYLCLPRDPIWGHYEDTVKISAGVYGAEYQLDQRTLSNFFGTKMRHYYDDIPCAVCRTTRSSVLMIPDRNQCYEGWTRAYFLLQAMRDMRLHHNLYVWTWILKFLPATSMPSSMVENCFTLPRLDVGRYLVHRTSMVENWPVLVARNNCKTFHSKE